ncbi:hypothetical protein QTQ03_30040 [Micromonospora sp. WMMA1363]|uniref:hypothetical protein n=1 Tax=Micromonospora sp. WMMA1363 TaxID=3053985 RepID=UPI00259D2E93|nr:hypothetical protein [Micromonospora sp. WMMA1363]MDM4723446.1 hypothetical protein [Micromonospora sp. WMMA1363]MDM4723602.1 hypothetical protein [Micromonospora sp. WMMA1363]
MYCSAACRQEAYRRRNAGVGPAAVRRAEAARAAELQAAGAVVQALLAELDDDLDTLRYTVDRRSPYAQLSYEVRGLAGRVEQLAAAAVAYGRALGVPWAEIAEDTGVDETTLRRRQRRAGCSGT